MSNRYQINIDLRVFAIWELMAVLCWVKLPSIPWNIINNCVARNLHINLNLLLFTAKQLHVYISSICNQAYTKVITFSDAVTLTHDLEKLINLGHYHYQCVCATFENNLFSVFWIIAFTPFIWWVAVSGFDMKPLYPWFFGYGDIIVLYVYMLNSLQPSDTISGLNMFILNRRNLKSPVSQIP